MANQIIVVGGGLSGLSAAHTVLEHGLNVLVIDKNAFFGGNSTKATSGINGALTKTQIRKFFLLLVHTCFACNIHTGTPLFSSCRILFGLSFDIPLYLARSLVRV
ncbi:hypothetical protein F5H01DRAFT_80998 [Linnemannia elongata]|nr:hypothetical protein F5H01DRAFT_80998 [Linnemannia elongata]